MIAASWLQISGHLTLGDLIVGLGTLALAAFTYWLGRETRLSANAARAAVEAAEEPFVIATPSEAELVLRPNREPRLAALGQLPPGAIERELDERGSAHVRMRLWNIGHGPAIVDSVAIFESRRARGYVEPSEVSWPLGAGQAVDIELASSVWPDRVVEGGTLLIVYTHASGRRYETRSMVEIAAATVRCRSYARSRTP